MIATFLTLSLLAAAPDRLELAGRVVDAGGKPVVDANVLIHSAAVRRGTSPVCPSCYLDCRKNARTDKDGQFCIASLDPELVFNVLVVADGYRPTFARMTDPARGPIDIGLARLDLESLDPTRVVRGVVLGPDDRPQAGAKVFPHSFSTGGPSAFRPGIFDPVAVTNLRGEFVLTATEPVASADLRVVGNAIAPRLIRDRKPQANPHQLRMTAGATLTGRLVRDGKPVAAAEVGLVQSDRNIVTFLGNSTVGTDGQGRFTFSNVHPYDDYFVYGLMGTFQDEGATPARLVHVDGEGTTVDVGDITVVRGHRIGGLVRLSDGKRLPPKTRLLVDREDAWDSRLVEVAPDGRFEVSGLPSERYSLVVAVEGYRISPKNHSADTQHLGRLVGTIDQDIDALGILLEPALANR